MGSTELSGPKRSCKISAINFPNLKELNIYYSGSFKFKYSNQEHNIKWI